MGVLVIDEAIASEVSCLPVLRKRWNEFVLLLLLLGLSISECLVMTGYGKGKGGDGSVGHLAVCPALQQTPLLNPYCNLQGKCHLCLIHADIGHTYKIW